MKRTRSSESNEDIAAKSHIPKREQQLSALTSLRAPVSPPRRNTTIAQPKKNQTPPSSKEQNLTPNLAAIEAGEVEVMDHISIFSSQLRQFTRPLSDSEPIPRLPIPNWINLYRRNERPEGHHFVIHQHDHPVAGPHYDLRLQFSESSSVSWSIMYGLPGDPNSGKLNRNATETRVHCLWNHLVETASSKTGSLIIWDTGEYEIRPYKMDQSPPETDDSQSDVSVEPDPVLPGEQVQISESVKLREAFGNRKIRLRLHGTRLPKDYTVILRMDKSTDYARPLRNGPKRRRRAPPSAKRGSAQDHLSTSDSGSSSPPPSDERAASRIVLSSPSSRNPVTSDHQTSESEHGDHVEKSDIDMQIQKNNAYPGSNNTIGSIHQRRWYLSLDRWNSGFEAVRSGDLKQSKKKWVRRSNGDNGPLLGSEPFYVRGPEVERSVVTGRLGRDVLHDEDVRDFVARRGWRPVLH